MSDIYFVDDFTEDFLAGTEFDESSATKIVGITATEVTESNWDDDFVFEESEISIGSPKMQLEMGKDKPLLSGKQAAGKLPLPSPNIRKTLTRAETAIGGLRAVKPPLSASFESPKVERRGKRPLKDKTPKTVLVRRPTVQKEGPLKDSSALESLPSLKKLAAEVIRKIPQFDEMASEETKNWKAIFEDNDAEEAERREELVKEVKTVEEAKELYQWQLNEAVEKKIKYDEAKSYYDLGKNLHRLENYGEAIFNVAIAKSMLQKKKHKGLKETTLIVCCYIASAEGEMCRELYNTAVDHLTTAILIAEEYSLVDLKAYIYFLFARNRKKLHMEMRAILSYLQYASAVVELVADPSAFNIKGQEFGQSPFTWSALCEVCLSLGQLLHSRDLDELAKEFLVRAENLAKLTKDEGTRSIIQSEMSKLKVTIVEKGKKFDDFDDDWDLEFEMEDQSAADPGNQLKNLADLLKRQITSEVDTQDETDVDKRYQVFGHDEQKIKIVSYPQSCVAYGNEELHFSGEDIESLLKNMVSRHAKKFRKINLKTIGIYFDEVKCSAETVRDFCIHSLNYMHLLSKNCDLDGMKKFVKRFFKELHNAKLEPSEDVFWYSYQLLEICLADLPLSSRSMQNGLNSLKRLAEGALKGCDMDFMFELMKLECGMETNSPLSEQGELLLYELNNLFKKAAAKLANGKELLNMNPDDYTEVKFKLEDAEKKASLESPLYSHPVHILAGVLSDVKLYVTRYKPLSIREEKEMYDDFAERDEGPTDPDGLNQMSQEQQMTILEIVLGGVPKSKLRTKILFTLGHYYSQEASKSYVAESMLWEAALSVDESSLATFVTLYRAKEAVEMSVPAVLSGLGTAILSMLGITLLANKKYLFGVLALEAEVYALWQQNRGIEKVVRRLAVVSSDNLDYPRALNYYFQIISLAVRDMKLNEVIYICEIISGLYFKIGEFRSAELFLRYASRISFPSFSFERADRVDAQFLQLQLKLASVYIRSNRLENAYDMLSSLLRCPLPHGKEKIVLSNLVECLIKKRWYEECSGAMEKHEKTDSGKVEKAPFLAMRSQDVMNKSQFFEVKARNYRNGGQHFSALACIDTAIEVCDPNRLKTLGKFYYLKGKVLDTLLNDRGVATYPMEMKPEDENLMAQIANENLGHIEIETKTIENKYEMMEYAVECFEMAYSFFRSVMDDISIAKTTNHIAETQLTLYVSPVLLHGRSFRSVVSAFTSTGAKKISENEIDVEEKLEKLKQPVILSLDIAADVCHVHLLLRSFANLVEIYLLTNNRAAAKSYWNECKNYLFSLFFVGSRIPFVKRANPSLLEKIYFILSKLARSLLCFEKEFINTHMIVFDAHVNLTAELEAAYRRSSQPRRNCEDIPAKEMKNTENEEEDEKVNDFLPFLDGKRKFGHDFYDLIVDMNLVRKKVDGCVIYSVRTDEEELKEIECDDFVFTTLHRIQMGLQSYTSGGTSQHDVHSHNIQLFKQIYARMRDKRLALRKNASAMSGKFIKDSTKIGSSQLKRMESRPNIRLGTGNNYVTFTEMEKRVNEKGTQLNVLYILYIFGEILYYCPNTGARRVHGFELSRNTKFQGFKSLRGKLQNIDGMGPMSSKSYPSSPMKCDSEEVSVSESSGSVSNEDTYHIFETDFEALPSSSLTSDMLQLIASYIISGREDSAAFGDSAYRLRLCSMMKEIIFYDPVTLLPTPGKHKKRRASDLQKGKASVIRLSKKMNVPLDDETLNGNYVLILSPTLHAIPWEAFFLPYYPVRSFTLMDYFKFQHVEVRKQDDVSFDSTLFFNFINEHHQPSDKALEVSRKDWLCDNTLWMMNHSPYHIHYGMEVSLYAWRVPYHSPLVKMGQGSQSKKKNRFVEFVQVSRDPISDVEMALNIRQTIVKRLVDLEKVAQCTYHPILLVSFADMMDLPPVLLNILSDPNITEKHHVTVCACPSSHIKHLVHSLTKVYDYTIRSMEKKNINLMGDLFKMLLSSIKTFATSHAIPVSIFNAPVTYVDKEDD